MNSRLGVHTKEGPINWTEGPSAQTWRYQVPLLNLQLLLGIYSIIFEYLDPLGQVGCKTRAQEHRLACGISLYCASCPWFSVERGAFLQWKLFLYIVYSTTLELMLFAPSPTGGKLQSSPRV